MVVVVVGSVVVVGGTGGPGAIVKASVIEPDVATNAADSSSALIERWSSPWLGCELAPDHAAK